MQAIPLDVVNGHFLQAADSLARPVVARHATLAGPSPDVGTGHRSLDIDIDTRGSGIGNGIYIALDILDLVTIQGTYLERSVFGEGHRGRAGDHRATGCRLATIGSVNKNSTTGTRSNGERHIAHIVAGRLADDRVAHDATVLAHMTPVDAVGDIHGIAITILHQFIAVGATVGGSTAQLQVEVAASTLGLKDVATTALLLREDGALVVDTSSTTGLDAVVDLIAVNQIVLVEHTGGARHGQNECVGCHNVGLQAVIVGALTRIVVIDEGH